MFQVFGNEHRVFVPHQQNSQKRIRIVAFFLAWALLIANHSCLAETVSLTGQTMGTTYSIKVITPSAQIAEDLKTQVDQRLTELDGAMSTWKPESEVSRFNAFESTDEWFPIGRDTFQVVRLALEMSSRTDGAFDITAAPIIGLWSFGASSRDSFVPPSESEIQATLELVGFDKIELSDEPPRIRKSVAGLNIDLSAIAKGYAVDEIASILDSQQLGDYMVEIGGEVIVSGQREDNTAWRIGIEAPQKNARELAVAIPLVETAIASSGDYRNFFEYEGKSYSHIVDPRTGKPAAGDLTAISVLSKDCATADAIATAMLVLGFEAAHQWCQENGISALLFERNGKKVSHSTTNEFPMDANVAAAGKTSYAVILLASGIVFSIAFAALAVGAIVKGKCLQGSCGGLANLSGKVDRSLCETCDKRIRNECTNDSNPPVAS